MSDHRAVEEEPGLFLFTAGAAAHPDLAGVTYIRTIESARDNVEKVLGVTLGRRATTEEVMAARRGDVYTGFAWVLIMQARERAAGADPAYRTLLAQADASADKSEAARLRRRAGLLADAARGG